MQNRCENGFPLTREIMIMGHKVRAKNYICARDEGPYRPKPEKIKLQLSIMLTRYCAAHCYFCIAAPTCDEKRLDPARLRWLLEQLRDEDCIRGISITGGEPFTDPVLLNEVIGMIFEIFGYDMEVTLDTNGSWIREISGLHDLMHLDTVHISRHHWDDGINDRLFGCAMPSAGELRAVIRDIGVPDLFVMNCMLLKDGVATAEDAHRYMDFASETGAGKVSFITASPVNVRTSENRVDFGNVLRDDDPDMLFTRGYRDFSYCRCRDGVYRTSQGRLIAFYGRCTDTAGLDYCRGLVIDPYGMLRDGFSGTVIAGEEGAEKR